MSKSTYLVKVIHKGREKDYFDFWKRNLQKNAAGEDLDATLVGFEVSQDARTPDEAIASVRKKHPGCQIDTQATLKAEQEI